MSVCVHEVFLDPSVRCGCSLSLAAVGLRARVDCSSQGLEDLQHLHIYYMALLKKLTTPALGVRTQVKRLSLK